MRPLRKIVLTSKEVVTPRLRTSYIDALKSGRDRKLFIPCIQKRFFITFPFLLIYLRAMNIKQEGPTTWTTQIQATSNILHYPSHSKCLVIVRKTNHPFSLFSMYSFTHLFLLLLSWEETLATISIHQSSAKVSVIFQAGLSLCNGSQLNGPTIPQYETNNVKGHLLQEYQRKWGP